MDCSGWKLIDGLGDRSSRRGSRGRLRRYRGRREEAPLRLVLRNSAILLSWICTPSIQLKSERKQWTGSKAQGNRGLCCSRSALSTTSSTSRPAMPSDGNRPAPYDNSPHAAFRTLEQQDDPLALHRGPLSSSSPGSRQSPPRSGLPLRPSSPDSHEVPKPRQHPQLFLGNQRAKPWESSTSLEPKLPPVVKSLG